MAAKKGKFILSIGDEGGILTYMQGKNVVRRLYAPSPNYSDTKAFVELLQTDTKAPVSMLVDLMDQSYVQQLLPPVSSLSINNLIKRKMERDFAASDLKGALPIGRETEGRRDWRYLFVTLSHSSLLQAWFDLVTELPNRFVGVYLLPVEAELFMQRLREGISGKTKRRKKSNALDGTAESQWQLLVAHNKVGGFRQVVVRNGKLIFARLAQPIGDSLPEVVAGNIEQEITVTTEYLKRLGYSDDQGMDVYVITSQDIKSALDINNINASTAYLFTPYEAADKIGLEQAVEQSDQFADVLLAAAFSTSKKQQLRLETQEQQKLNQLYSGLIAIKAGTALSILGALLAIGYYGLQIPKAKQEIETATRQSQQAEHQLNELRELERNLPDNLEKITDLVAMHKLLNALGFTPLEALHGLKLVSTPENMVLFNDIKWESQGSSVAQSSAGRSQQTDGGEEIKLSFTVHMYGTEVGSKVFNERIDAFEAELREAFRGYEVELRGERPGGSEQKTIISFEEQRDPILDKPFYSLSYEIKGNGKVDGESAPQNAKAGAGGYY